MDDLYDLNLPEVPPGQEPLPSPPATLEAIFAHARLLLKNLPPDFWEPGAVRDVRGDGIRSPLPSQ